MSKSKNIVCFGEVLWDVYPDTKRLGGAPFNVAAHLTQLGTQGHIISRIGSDKLGSEIKEAIIAHGVNPDTVQTDKNFPTGTVLVTLDNSGIPEYHLKEPAAWDFIHTNLENLDLIQKCDAMVFGSLACRSERNITSLRDFVQLSKLNICDLNIRQNYYSADLIKELLSFADILKINEDESKLLQRILELDSNSFFDKLANMFELQVIIKTKGGDGSEAFYEGELYKASGIKIEVVDTIGSGDAFLAAFLHHYLAGADIQQCLNNANALGAYVATHHGAIPNKMNQI